MISLIISILVISPTFLITYFFPSLESQILVFTIPPPSKICNHLIIQGENVIRMGDWELHFYWFSAISSTQPDAHNLLLDINTLFISLCQNYLHTRNKKSYRKVDLLNRCFNFHFDEKHRRTTRSETVSTIQNKGSCLEVSVFLSK